MAKFSVFLRLLLCLAYNLNLVHASDDQSTPGVVEMPVLVTAATPTIKDQEADEITTKSLIKTVSSETRGEIFSDRFAGSLHRDQYQEPIHGSLVTKRLTPNSNEHGATLSESTVQFPISVLGRHAETAPVDKKFEKETAGMTIEGDATNLSSAVGQEKPENGRLEEDSNGENEGQESESDFSRITSPSLIQRVKNSLSNASNSVESVPVIQSSSKDEEKLSNNARSVSQASIITDQISFSKKSDHSNVDSEEEVHSKLLDESQTPETENSEVDEANDMDKGLNIRHSTKSIQLNVGKRYGDEENAKFINVICQMVFKCIVDKDYLEDTSLVDNVVEVFSSYIKSESQSRLNGLIGLSDTDQSKLLDRAVEQTFKHIQRSQNASGACEKGKEQFSSVKECENTFRNSSDPLTLTDPNVDSANEAGISHSTESALHEHGVSTESTPSVSGELDTSSDVENDEGTTESSPEAELDHHTTKQHGSLSLSSETTNVGTDAEDSGSVDEKSTTSEYLDEYDVTEKTTTEEPTGNWFIEGLKKVGSFFTMNSAPKKDKETIEKSSEEVKTHEITRQPPAANSKEVETSNLNDSEENSDENSEEIQNSNSDSGMETEPEASSTAQTQPSADDQLDEEVITHPAFVNVTPKSEPNPEQVLIVETSEPSPLLAFTTVSAEKDIVENQEEQLDLVPLNTSQSTEICNGSESIETTIGIDETSRTSDNEATLPNTAPTEPIETSNLTEPEPEPVPQDENHSLSVKLTTSSFVTQTAQEFIDFDWSLRLTHKVYDAHLEDNTSEQFTEFRDKLEPEVTQIFDDAFKEMFLELKISRFSEGGAMAHGTLKLANHGIPDMSELQKEFSRSINQQNYPTHTFFVDPNSLKLHKLGVEHRDGSELQDVLPTSTETISSESDGFPGYAIGIVIGVIILVAVLLSGILIYTKRRHRQRTEYLQSIPPPTAIKMGGRAVKNHRVYQVPVQGYSGPAAYEMSGNEPKTPESNNGTGVNGSYENQANHQRDQQKSNGQGKV